MKTKITTPKFSVGQKVYAYLPDGMSECTVESICIHINSDDSYSLYYLDKGEYKGRKENQLYADIVTAKKKLVENSNQLQLSLT